jgi:hypothetical protein
MIQHSQKAIDLFHSVAQTVANLGGRWQDEKEYENIEDYKKALEPRATPFGATITKMSKRPFGFDFTVEGGTYSLRVRMNGQASLDRIA